MEYNFFVLTTQGLKNANVDSPYLFGGAPFGYTPYHLNGSCELDQIIIDDFWRCVDSVLEQNSLTSAEFVRVVKAYCGSILYGEVYT